MTRVRCTISVPPDELEVWRKEAERRDRSLSVLVRDAMDSKLERAEKFLNMKERRVRKVTLGGRWLSGWPKDRACFHCQKYGKSMLHDPVEAHGGVYTSETVAAVLRNVEADNG